jgi:hypothetical protein
MEDKIALIRLSLTDNIDNPNFEANRKYALKILNELQEQVKNCSIPDVVQQSEPFYCKSGQEDIRGLKCVYPCGSNSKCKFLQ